MDNLDRKLIAALRDNARAGFSDLAALLGVSRATVRARMQKLEASGDVQGYKVVLKGDVVEAPVRGLMMVEIEGRGTERILRQLNGMSELVRLWSTNGRWDVIVEIGTDTLEEFDAVLFRIRRLDGVTRSETSLLLSTRKSR
ncbi:MAG: Lrp/AsnC family transcriptional regulator [Marinovum sp.]|nr:Lrp/AsnC family transcriptional regulator [Marinovum sp.]